MLKYSLITILFFAIMACTSPQKAEKLKIAIIDPGHFHAALVLKQGYQSVSEDVEVFAPEGSEFLDFKSKIEQYNSREEDPTNWKLDESLSQDYLGSFVFNSNANVVVLAGKNDKKITYIEEALGSGKHVLSDKPMCINQNGLEKLQKAFQLADANDLLLYDIMTERFEVSNYIQKLLANNQSVFGTLEKGTPDEPAIIKESVHHFYKMVSGKPLVRPFWFYNTQVEGEGIVDVTTHLVDLVQWAAFPETIIDTNNIEMLNAKSWETVLSNEEYRSSTTVDIPQSLIGDDGNIHVSCNGNMLYTINGVHTKVEVRWDYKAPEGTGDTHYSIMRGTKSDIIIKQGEAESYTPTVYVKIHDLDDAQAVISNVLNSDSSLEGVSIEAVTEDLYKVVIPNQLRKGHEHHFSEVTKNYLSYLKNGKLPDWEVPNMISKYYTTIKALNMAQSEK